MRAEPIFFLPFVEHDLQGTHPDNQQADSPVVDPCPLAAKIRWIEYESLGEEYGNSADRHIDVENPAPAVIVGEPAAENWPEHRSNYNTQCPERHRLPALLRRK